MQQQLTKEGVKYLLAPFCWILFMMIVFFIAAGRLDVPRAWLAFGIHLVGAALGALLMYRFAPELANQRASARQGTKGWDKAILMIYFLLLLLAIPLTAGLDVGRYHWSDLQSMGLGVVCYFLFFIIFYWAMLINKFFEGTSRIQTDRGHRVICSGPYAYVRHPGYVAMIFASVSDALIIGSLYALIPSCLAVGVTIVRTGLEDKMLRSELDGYAEYAATVKYRLFPGIW
ncbi:methyltransferase family protein [Solidesulfovibrio sp. C21]|uniref:methyltransferase family protein n=1 Tax=Solidesulfovibrio sp. C21 TaxID=3398613 RepID=UPI0039FD3CD7